MCVRYKLSAVAYFFALLAINFASQNAEGKGDCAEYKNVYGQAYGAIIDETKFIRNESILFGFNLEWYAFQVSLWDKNKHQLYPEIQKYLNVFKNSVYRYPGGQTANVMDWRDFVGPNVSRKANLFFNWRPAVVADFGINEYFQFVHDVGGQAWYVVNVYGALSGEQESKELANSAAKLAKYIEGENDSNFPQILRWELGNELDRKPIFWSPQKTVGQAAAVANAISSINSNARFVIAQEEFPALKNRGYSLERYNSDVATGLKKNVSEYAMHLYYDGPPYGLPVQAHLETLCNVVSKLNQLGNKDPVIWITESGRVPNGAWTKSDWKSDWSGTADLHAAISTADFFIGLSKIPQVKGAFQHALHGADAPWPMFHPDNNGSWRPSAVYWVLAMLKQSELPYVFDGINIAPERSTNGENTNLRIVVKTDFRRENYVIWVVNRLGKETSVNVNIKSFASNLIDARRSVLTSKNLEDNNYMENQVVPRIDLAELSFDENGTAALRVDKYSVTVLEFKVKINK